MNTDYPDGSTNDETMQQELRTSADYIARAQCRSTLTDDLERALADYIEAIRLAPASADAYVGRAFVRNRMGDYAGALADYTEALRFDPFSTDAYSGRASVFAQTGDYERAIADYTEAIRLAPHDDANFYCRAFSYEQTGDYARAIADYTEAIRLAPTDYNYEYRANAYAAIGDSESVVADLKKAAESDSEEWWGWHDRLGSLYAAKGEIANAVDAYRKALALNPTDSQRQEAMQDYLSKHL